MLFKADARVATVVAIVIFLHLCRKLLQQLLHLFDVAQEAPRVKAHYSHVVNDFVAHTEEHRRITSDLELPQEGRLLIVDLPTHILGALA